MMRCDGMVPRMHIQVRALVDSLFVLSSSNTYHGTILLIQLRNCSHVHGYV